VSSPYGYGQGQPPGVLPPPQAQPWPQQPYPQQQPYGRQPYGQQYPGQWAQPYRGGGYPQFNGFGPPPPRRTSGCLKVLMFGVAAFVFVIIGIVLLLGAVVKGAGDDSTNRRTPGRVGPSIVPTATSNPEQGTAEDILVNAQIYQAGGLGELNCPAEKLGSGDLAAQKRYYQKLFKCLNDGWRPVLDKIGIKQPDPGLVVFDRPVNTPCGNFKPLSGRVLAFYCYGNHVMYTDVLQMNKAFGPREDLAYLLTIAHEYGHHIQGATGLFYARAVYLQEHPAEKLNSSRRNELQASCFGGVFTRAVANSYPLTDRRKELEFQSSNSFGDSSDTPADMRTHGKATSQGFWIMNGFNIGETKACNTFAAPANLVQ
jgi:uncharacterized protein